MKNIKKFNEHSEGKSYVSEEDLYLLKAVQNNLLMVINNNVLNDLDKDSLNKKLSTILEQIDSLIERLK